MKKLTLTSLLILITLGFSSCSSEDDSAFLQEPSAEDLLKSFNINKDASGQYSLDYELGRGAAADNVVDSDSNTNNIYLYSSDSQRQPSMKSQGLAIQDGELKVSFNNTDSDKKHTVTVLDDDIKMKAGGNEYLESYGVTGNGDGTYDLDFKVVDGVAVDFIYNGDRDVYEVHLVEDNDASQADFIQTFIKEEGIDLKIEFVNNANSYAKTESSHPNRPAVVIGN